MAVPLPPLMAREEFLDHGTLAPKLLQLNNWIFNGQLKDGTAPDYKRRGGANTVSGGYFFHSRALNAGKDAPDGTAIRELARTALMMVDSQIFLDGNTRTSALLMLEYLASVGVLYTNDPVRLYWILAAREVPDTVYDPEETKAALEKELRDSTYKPVGGITAAARQQYAVKIRDAPTIHQWRDDLTRQVMAAQGMEEKRAVLRRAKYENKLFYACIGAKQQKAWASYLH